MKYKVGDKVKIKSLDWYNENKNEDGKVSCGRMEFVFGMTELCGKVCEITQAIDGPLVSYYRIKEDFWSFNDEMIECCANADINTLEYKIDKLADLLKTDVNDIKSSIAELKNRLDTLENKTNSQPSEGGNNMGKVKTFEDACEILGENHPLVLQYNFNFNDESGWKNGEYSVDLEAYLKLRIICEALNDGWKPIFSEEENKYYPIFHLYSKEDLNCISEEEKKDRHMVLTVGYDTEYAAFGFGMSVFVTPNSDVFFCKTLCLKSEELSNYCGKQFIDLWMNLKLRQINIVNLDYSK